MKKIEAIIRPGRLEAVRETLESLGYPGMMVAEIEGHGKQKGLVRQFRGREYKVELLPKMKVDIVAKKEDAGRIIKAIVKTARTGEIGDGKVFVSSIEEVVRIRTGEKGETAL